MEINFAILIRFLSQLCVIFRDVFNSLRRRPLKIWDVLFGTNTDHLSFGHLENLHCGSSMCKVFHEQWKPFVEDSLKSRPYSIV